MGKDTYAILEEARQDVGKLIKHAARLAAAAIKDRTEEEARLAFDLPAKDAPKWTDLVQKVTAAASRSETEHPATFNQNLNVIMVGRDSSIAEWKNRVADAQPKKQEAIEAEVEPAEPKPGA